MNFTIAPADEQSSGTTRVMIQQRKSSKSSLTSSSSIVVAMSDVHGDHEQTTTTTTMTTQMQTSTTTSETYRNERQPNEAGQVQVNASVIRYGNSNNNNDSNLRQSTNNDSQLTTPVGRVEFAPVTPVTHLTQTPNERQLQLPQEQQSVNFIDRESRRRQQFPRSIVNLIGNESTSLNIMENNNGNNNNHNTTTTTRPLEPSKINQINRANFYNNLGFQVSTKNSNNKSLNIKTHNHKYNSGDSYCYNRQYPAVISETSNYSEQPNHSENILLFATEHDRRAQSVRNGERRNNNSNASKQQAAAPNAKRSGQLMTKTKSATLPPASNGRNDNDHDDDEYDDIRLVTDYDCNINGSSSNIISSNGQHSSRVSRAPYRNSVRSTKISGGPESHSYLSFGSPSQRASRSSLSATRVGKFVDHYPANRLPQNSASSSPNHKRHTSPYAFHVPLYRQRSLSRTRSPPPPPLSPPAVYYPPPTHQYNSSPTADYYATCHQDQQHLLEAENELLEQLPLDDTCTGPVKQARYGYVAPIERIIESRASSKQEKEPLPPASKFNKSLRSRTIGHIPSMVQVSVEDNSLARCQLSPATATNKQVKLPDIDYYNNANLINRSEGDLLKAHVIAWRHSNKFDLGHDNPFKPGTKLSWEADLMVRLMKRGYPLDELPSLVEATKEVVARKESSSARSKSCDRLGGSASAMSTNGGGGGYLKSNIVRQYNNTSGNNEHHRVKMAPPPSSKSYGNLLVENELSEGQQHQQLDYLEPCKRIWANSLSRAKSLPRFHHQHSTSGDAGQCDQCQVASKSPTLKKADLAKAAKAQTTREDNGNETDSLDKLITSIEQEISDLLISQQGKDLDKKNLASETIVQASPRRRPSKLKASTKLASSFDGQNKGNSQSIEGSPRRKLQSVTQVRKQHQRPARPMDLSSSKSTGELAALSKGSNLKQSSSLMVKKKKSRCCRIQ